MSLILCFDFGMKYIGVATGQTITKTATAITSLKAKDGIPNKEELSHLINQWKPAEIVVGLPLNMDGTSQQITNAAKKFGNRIKEQYKVPVHFEDERLTSWEVKNQDNTHNFDALNAEAARIILQQWLDAQR